MAKVCHITSVHNRYDDRIFYKECSFLAKGGHDIVLLVNDMMADEKRNGVNIISTHKMNKGRLHRMLNIRSILKKAIEINAEIYHLHDPELLLIAHGLKKYNKKVIFDSHEYYYMQIQTKSYIPKFLRGMLSKIYLRYETAIFHKIDGVIYAGNMCDENGIEIENFSNRCKRSTLIANYPISTKREQTNKQDNIEKSTPFQVCYAGGLSKDRGILQLMDACYMADVQLVLAGEFSSESFEQELRQRESFSCVDYRGLCTLDEVYEIYDKADVGAQVLLDVGQYYKLAVLGVKVYEYMQMKLPVIIFDSPYNIKMIEAYQFGIAVNPNDSKAIAKAIKKLKSDANLRKLMGQNAFKLYESNFSWESEVQKLLEFYQNLLIC